MVTAPSDAGTSDPAVRTWLRLAPLLVLAVMIGGAAAGALLTHDVVADQQRRLLDQRAREMATQLASSTDGLAGAFKLVGAVYLIEPARPTAFETIARSAVQGDVTAIGIAQTDGNQMVVRDVVTNEAQPFALTGPRLAATRRAARRGAAAVALLTDPVTHERRMFRAIPSAPGTVVYLETTIRPTQPTSSPTATSAGVDAIVYAASRPDPSRVVTSTNGQALLADPVAMHAVTVGADRWTVVVRAKGSLVGSFAPAVPWIMLGGGLFGAVMAAIVAEVLIRRRSYALRLVRERTEALRRTHDELDAARAVAESANRSKSEFLSRMSHELRTPLNAVLGFAQVLQLDVLEPEQDEAVNHIVKSGEHLLGLINEILDISRIETGDISLVAEPVDVGELIDETVEMIRPMVDTTSVQLVRSVPAPGECFVLADRQRLRQVLLNLLSNAVKYNREGGMVSVGCERSHGGSWARISVADTGMGLRPDQLDRLFVPFDRLGAEQTDVEGTGIGLTLSRRLAEAMGGVLDVESEPDRGSTFWVEVPLAEAPLPDAGELDQPSGVSERAPFGAERVVLYIEDDPANLRLVERIFDGRRDLRVLPATQGGIGLELARRQFPSVILLDLHLPDLGGEAVLAALREDPVTADIPVIVVTADAMPGQAERLLAAGAAATLTKPLEIRQLLDAVDAALTGGRICSLPDSANRP